MRKLTNNQTPALFPQEQPGPTRYHQQSSNHYHHLPIEGSGETGSRHLNVDIIDDTHVAQYWEQTNCVHQDSYDAGSDVEEFGIGDSRVRFPYKTRSIIIKFGEKQQSGFTKNSQYPTAPNWKKQITLRRSRQRAFEFQRQAQPCQNTKSTQSRPTQSRLQIVQHSNLGYCQPVNVCIASPTSNAILGHGHRHGHGQDDGDDVVGVCFSYQKNADNAKQKNNHRRKSKSKSKSKSKNKNKNKTKNKKKIIMDRSKILRRRSQFIQGEVSQSEPENQAHLDSYRTQIINHKLKKSKYPQLQLYHYQQEEEQRMQAHMEQTESISEMEQEEEQGDHRARVNNMNVHLKNSKHKNDENKKKPYSQFSTNYHSKNNITDVKEHKIMIFKQLSRKQSHQNLLTRSTLQQEQSNPSIPTLLPNSIATSINPPTSTITPSSSPLSGMVEQTYLSKVLSEMMMQNNEYLHRVNEVVVNRLLNIIENNGTTGASNQATNMKNSRSNEKQSYYSRKTDPRNLHVSVKYDSMDTSPIRNKNSIPTANASLLKNERDRTEVEVEQINSVVIASIQSPTCISLDSILKQQQEDLTKLQQKRSNTRKPREFPVSKPVTPTPLPAQTPRNPTSVPNIQMVASKQEIAPLVSPIHLIESQQASNQVSHQASLFGAGEGEEVKEKGFEKEGEIEKGKGAKSSEKNDTNIEKIRVQSSLKKAVFMEISKGDNEEEGGGGLTLAEAFKRKIGKLPTRQQRKAKQQAQKQRQPDPAHKEKEPIQASRIGKKSVAPVQMQKKPEPLKLRCPEKQCNSAYTTPKSKQPSQELLSRLIGGSKAKISKKDMYALTRKNYQNLPEVVEKRRLEQKRAQELERLNRIKEYQKSIRASKISIMSTSSLKEFPDK